MKRRLHSLVALALILIAHVRAVKSQEPQSIIIQPPPPPPAYNVIWGFSSVSGSVNPSGVLVATSDGLYGTTPSNAATSTYGVIYKLGWRVLGGRNYYNPPAGIAQFNGANGSSAGNLSLNGSTLYGVTYDGGNDFGLHNGYGEGTIFTVNTTGTGITTLYSFTVADGSSPATSQTLTVTGNVIYGVTTVGGEYYGGTVFSVNTDGTNYTVIYSFNSGIALAGPPNTSPGYPTALAVGGSALYGLAKYGGENGGGAIFSVNADGSGFQTLHSFANNANPSGFRLYGNAIYGTTGENGGTLFKINTDGSAYTVLRTFATIEGQGLNNPILSPDGTKLFGSAQTGGNNADGTIYSLNTDGTGFTVLKSFAGNDGQYPNDLTFGTDGTTLYGTTMSSSTGSGLVFSFNTLAAPLPTTMPVTFITSTAATLNGTVNAFGNSTSISFDYGTDTSYGTNVPGTPTSVTGTGDTAVSATITGLTPGTLYHFRVNGTSNTNASNGGDLTFTTLTPIQNWRQQWFGTTANTGNAANTADPYNKGIQNLATFSFLGPAQDPSKTSVAQLPQVQMSGGNFLYSFTQPLGVTGVTYGALWSPTLAPGSWLEVTDTGTGAQHIFSVPIGTNAQMFMQLTVTSP